MKKKRFLVALAAVAILIPLLVGCDAFGTGAPPAAPIVPASIPQLEGRMSSLESRVSGVEGKITDTSTLQTDLEQLRTDFDAFVALATEEEGTTTELAATIAELNDRIAALEKQFDEEGENGAATEEIAKWYKDIYCLNHYLETIKSQVDGESDVVIKSLRFSPSKIQEADDYTVSFEIYNNTLEEIGNLQIEITLRPRTGSRVVVDEDEVYLDTTASPFYYWDTDVVTRGDGTCRRIAFLSSPEIRLDAGEVEGEDFKPSMTVLRLVFTLAYE